MFFFFFKQKAAYDERSNGWSSDVCSSDLRRSQRNETPYGRRAEDFGGGAGDSIRQLIHELRSPLNAISGFAQIISGQMFGPVNQGYRGMAQAIVADAAAVQAIINDLETAAKAGAKTTAEPVSSGDITDIGAILVQVEADLAGLSNDPYVGLSIPRIGGPFQIGRAQV